jgi:hypothetical protein
MSIKVTKSDLTQMRVYPDTFKHPKMLKVSADARWTAFELWAYCHKYRTDGHVPNEVIKDIPLEQIRELVQAGLMEQDKNRAAWMHDYTDWQPSRAQLEAYEAAQAEAAQRRSQAGKVAAGARWHKAS